MRFKSMWLLAGLTVAGAAQASISLSTTRVIFDARYKEATVEVRNGGAGEVLLQSWLDNGNEDKAALPFAISPPLAKAPAAGRQVLRVLYQGAGMPADRESVIWLNVQEIPQKPEGESVLQLAVRQRIKVFFRPVDLAGSALEAPAQLQWKLSGKGTGATSLEVHNPSLFHVSLAAVALKSVGYDSPMDGTTMIAPGERREIPMKAIGNQSNTELTFASINDWGGLDEFATNVSFAQAVQGKPVKQPSVAPRADTEPAPAAPSSLLMMPKA
jgi:P pilus assembly chaperone PapD